MPNFSIQESTAANLPADSRLYLQVTDAGSGAEVSNSEHVLPSSGQFAIRVPSTTADKWPDSIRATVSIVTPDGTVYKQPIKDNAGNTLLTREVVVQPPADPIRLIVPVGTTTSSTYLPRWTSDPDFQAGDLIDIYVNDVDSGPAAATTSGRSSQTVDLVDGNNEIKMYRVRGSSLTLLGTYTITADIEAPVVQKSVTFPQDGTTLTSSSLLLRWASTGFTSTTLADFYMRPAGSTSWIDQGPAPRMSAGQWPESRAVPQNGQDFDVLIVAFEEGETVEQDSNGEPTSHEFWTATITQNTVESNIPSGTLVQSLEFPSSSIPIGSVNSSSWSSFIQGQGGRIFSTNDQELAVVQRSGKSWLRARHRPTSVGSTRIVSALSLPNRNRYQVRFTFELMPGFDFGKASGAARSGKLGFGLAGGADNNGQLVSGGTVDPDGFTARFIHRGDSLKIYTYNWNRTQREQGLNPAYGDEYPLPAYPVSANGPKLSIGEPHDVVLELELNSTNTPDGTLKAWFDGAQFVDANDMEWMSTNMEIDRLMFASFHGGGSATSPSQDVFIEYTNVEVRAL